MSFIINQGFSLKSPQFNFERDYFKDLASLKAASLNDFPDHFVTNVAGVLYVLNKANSDNATTGKWRKLVNSAGNTITVDGSLSLTSTNPIQNNVVTAALDGKASIAIATTSANGLLSSKDKAKLDGIASGANKTVVDTALSSTSTNPVQNKVINTALAGKASTAVATQSANGLLSAADKKKLDGITAGGTADSAIDTATIDALFTETASETA